jgi:hypothetical protein
MAIYLRQSTASQEVAIGPFLDSTDGNTQETGLTIANTDIRLWKTGATSLANKNSGGATHMAIGVYSIVLDATDTDTLGPLVIYCHPTGALATRTECVVLAAAVYDAWVGGSLLTDVANSVWGDTLTLPGQVAPSNTPTAEGALAWLYKLARNKIESTASETRVYDDAGTTVDHKASVTDNGTTFTRAEFGAGP